MGVRVGAASSPTDEQRLVRGAETVAVEQVAREVNRARPVMPQPEAGALNFHLPTPLPPVEVADNDRGR
jgi:hypothetical protein